MNRWLSLLIIGFVVVSGLQGCVLVVADENVAHDIRVERDRSRLARAIQAEIDADAMLDDSDISVSEDDGDIMLSGEVNSVAALQRAIDIALSHAGVDDLDLHLEIEFDD